METLNSSFFILISLQLAMVIYKLPQGQAEDRLTLAKQRLVRGRCNVHLVPTNEFYSQAWLARERRGAYRQGMPGFGVLQ